MVLSVLDQALVDRFIDLAGGGRNEDFEGFPSCEFECLQAPQCALHQPSRSPQPSVSVSQGRCPDFLYRSSQSVHLTFGFYRNVALLVHGCFCLMR